MAKSENVISIPKPPTDAYNTNRPVSELLWTQVEHLAAVVKKDIDDERRAIRTEGEASDFIRKYTELLHPEGSKRNPAPSSLGIRKKPARSPQKSPQS